jgi:hypothetical protein
MHEEPATRPERLFYISTVGFMLFVGRVTSPLVARMAGVMASPLPAMAVKDIKTMNAAIRRLKANMPAVAEGQYKTPDLFTCHGLLERVYCWCLQMPALMKTFPKIVPAYL